MSEVKVNKISPRIDCGTVQLGDSGDTITIPAGATITNNGTQTGFGRTGTVNWDTTAKTAAFTAVSGNGYFVNTTSGAITVTLPATPSAGDIVSIADYAGTAATNNITIARNGSNINGAASDLTISKNNSAVTLVYVDGTQGWKGTVTSNLNDIETQPEYIVATGGTVTCCGDYKIHTFTSPGTFSVSSVGNPLGSTTVDYLVVAGGGGAAGIGSNNSGMAGGGAGGFRESGGTASGCYTTSPLGACVSALPVSVQGYPITVGAGGSGGASGLGNMGSNGSPSIFSTITSTGGGRGGGYCTNWIPGCAGGSGGGGVILVLCGSAGNTPPVSPPQGNPGGNAIPGNCGSAGGGGATSAGNNAVSPDTGGTGGNGAGTAINPAQGTPGPNGALKYFAGGGGGAPYAVPGTICGGYGGGGPSAAAAGSGVNGTTNTGGGAGGTSAGPGVTFAGASGGSGIVIIRYKYQ